MRIADRSYSPHVLWRHLHTGVRACGRHRCRDVIPGRSLVPLWICQTALGWQTRPAWHPCRFCLAIWIHRLLFGRTAFGEYAISLRRGCRVKPLYIALSINLVAQCRMQTSDLGLQSICDRLLLRALSALLSFLYQALPENPFAWHSECNGFGSLCWELVQLLCARMTEGRLAFS